MIEWSLTTVGWAFVLDKVLTALKSFLPRVED